MQIMFSVTPADLISEARGCLTIDWRTFVITVIYPVTRQYIVRPIKTCTLSSLVMWQRGGLIANVQGKGQDAFPWGP